MLVEQIKKDRMSAMKNGNAIAKGILTVLVGDIENKSTGGRVMSDTEVISLIKKYIFANEEVLQYKSDSNLIEENKVLCMYLPIQIGELEIESTLRDSGCTSLGSAMKYMKDNYAGQYDGKLASTVAKRLFP